MVALGIASNACKDNDPCDPGQEERLALCYAVAQAGANGAQGASGSGASLDARSDAGADAPAAPAALDTDFGTHCSDTTASSDCGGRAPLCAPFPAGPA